MRTFWQKHPALLYGVSFYLGCHFRENLSFASLIPVIVFLVSIFSFDRVQKARAILAIFVVVVSFCYLHVHVHSMPEDKEEVRGRGVFEVESCSSKVRFGRMFKNYRLNIHSFFSDDNSIYLRNIPCSLVLHGDRENLNGGTLYEISGTLLQNSSNVKLQSNFKKIEEKGKSFSLLNVRSYFQKCFKKFIWFKIPHTEARSFLEGIFSGDFQADILTQHIRKIGLHHIIVVSGFHFSIVAGCIGFILRMFLPWTLSYIGMLFGCTFYLIFVGPSASVLRAYVSCCLFVVAKLFKRESSGLNSLGVGLIVVLLYQPTFCREIGFVLSFLATLGILLFYRPCNMIIEKIFLPRPREIVEKMSYTDQLFYFLLTFFRSSFSLAIAVNIVVVPTILFLFQSFPLVSILYNLFFPFLVSIAMMLFLASLIFTSLPYLGSYLFYCTHSFTSWMLSYVNYVPESLKYKVEVETIPEWAIGLYLSLLIFAGILFYEKKHDHKVTIFDHV